MQKSALSVQKRRTWPRVLEELLVRLFSSPQETTSLAPHMRRDTSVDRLLLCFIWASAPALLFGLWNLGAQTLQVMLQSDLPTLSGWSWSFYTALGFDATTRGVIGPFLLGLSYFSPLLIVTLATGIFWEVVFATIRRRPIDPGWLMASWLYILLLPAALPPGLAVLGISFGLVFGKHIFGGTGKYLVSPALLGVLFLHLAYPSHFFAAGSFLPVAVPAAATTWTIVGGGLENALGEGLSWNQVFLGRQVGAFGTGSALLCLAGAALLIYKGAASFRTVLGAIFGLAAATLLFNSLSSAQVLWQLPWHWHLVLGNFAFGIVFIATDPTPSPATAEGRWIQGALIGVLTVLIRTLNPAHPEGTLYAILLAAMATPLIDHFIIRFRMARWQRRWRTR